MYRTAGESGLSEIAMIILRDGRVWALPKGLIDGGETPERTAVREVREETGLTAVIEDDLGESSYWFFIRDENVKCRKTVRYFLMKYKSGNTEDHDREVERAEWVPAGEALARATYRGDREIIKKALEMLEHVR